MQFIAILQTSERSVQPNYEPIKCLGAFGGPDPLDYLKRFRSWRGIYSWAELKKYYRNNLWRKFKNYIAL